MELSEPVGSEERGPLWQPVLRLLLILVALGVLFARVQSGSASVYEVRGFGILLWPGLMVAWYHVFDLVRRRVSFSQSVDLPLAAVLTAVVGGAAHLLLTAAPPVP